MMLPAFGAALQAGALPMLAPQAPQQQQQQAPQPPPAAAAAGGIGAEMALMHIGGGVAEAVRQIGSALRMLGAADLATVQGVEAAINACIAARGQLMGGASMCGELWGASLCGDLSPALFLHCCQLLLIISGLSRSCALCCAGTQHTKHNT
jgi:hypothetical protein